MAKVGNSKKTLKDIGEFGLISSIMARTPAPNARVIEGIGDDAAVLAGPEDRFLLATCDIQVEGIHFKLHTFSPEEIGCRSASVNLSDIAAMGGVPTYALLSVAAPPVMEVGFMERLYDGARRRLIEFGADIVGGNTSAIPDRLILDLTLLGEVERERVMKRRGAAVGDILCVTGSLGASRAGLLLSSRDDVSVGKGDEDSALAAYRTPTPRVDEGRVLGSTGKVTSCIDLSDGLLGDASHIAKMSGVGVYIDLDRLPVADCAKAVASALCLRDIEMAAIGGEDFELLFTVEKQYVDDVLDRLTLETGTRASAIGEVLPGPAEVRLTAGGNEITLSKCGFDHFFAV